MWFVRLHFYQSSILYFGQCGIVVFYEKKNVLFISMFLFLYTFFCPEQDFAVTVIFSLMWLVSSCCWAKSLINLKSATNPTEVLLLISACRAQDNRCAATQEPHWSRLNTSTVGIQSKNGTQSIQNNPIMCDPSVILAGFWVYKCCPLVWEYLVCLQRDGLVQDWSEVPNQECFRETFE